MRRTKEQEEFVAAFFAERENLQRPRSTVKKAVGKAKTSLLLWLALTSVPFVLTLIIGFSVYQHLKRVFGSLNVFDDEVQRALIDTNIEAFNTPGLEAYLMIYDNFATIIILFLIIYVIAMTIVALIHTLKTGRKNEEEHE